MKIAKSASFRVAKLLQWIRSFLKGEKKLSAHVFSTGIPVLEKLCLIPRDLNNSMNFFDVSICRSEILYLCLMDVLHEHLERL